MMDNLVWRKRARIAAWADLVITILEVLATVVAFVYGYIVHPYSQSEASLYVEGNTTHVIYKDDEERLEHPPEYGAFIGIIILMSMLAFVIAYFAVEFWAVVSLLKATEIGRETGDAIRLSRIWLIVTIVLVVLETIIDLFRGIDGLIILVIVLIINAGFVYVVQSFRKELKEIRGEALVNFPA